MLFIWFMLAGFIFLLTPHRHTKKLQHAFEAVFAWPLDMGSRVSLAARTRAVANVRNPREYRLLQKEYQRLQTHLHNLQAQLERKCDQLDALSGLRNRFPELKGAKLVPAVATPSVDGLRSMLVINRGKDDGLTEGQFVLADNSIIGTISDVSSGTAWVKLFTDPTANIPVNIAKLDVPRMMQGSGNNSAKVQLVPIMHKVKAGDIIYAREKPGYLDAPMVIGQVAQCKRDSEKPSLWDITVEPRCDLARLDSVTVIVMNPE